jgi:hypothetical protein
MYTFVLRRVAEVTTFVWFNVHSELVIMIWIHFSLSYKDCCVWCINCITIWSISLCLSGVGDTLHALQNATCLFYDCQFVVMIYFHDQIQMITNKAKGMLQADLKTNLEEREKKLLPPFFSKESINWSSVIDFTNECLCLSNYKRRIMLRKSICWHLFEVCQNRTEVINFMCEWLRLS